jgi:hypothetical protein
MGLSANEQLIGCSVVGLMLTGSGSLGNIKGSCWRVCRYRLGVRTRGSQPRDRGSNPRTGTNSPSFKLSVTCSGFLGGVFAFSEALFGGILKDS